METKETLKETWTVRVFDNSGKKDPWVYRSNVPSLEEAKRLRNYYMEIKVKHGGWKYSSLPNTVISPNSLNSETIEIERNTEWV